MTKGGENVYPGMSKGAFETTKKGKVTKTKEEFWVEEAEFTGGHPENVKFEESSFNKFGEHESDFREIEKFATGKNTVKGQIGSETKSSIQKHNRMGKSSTERKIDSLEKQNEDLADHFANYPKPDDMASGGRVPLASGKTPKKQTSDLIDVEWDDLDPYEWLEIIKAARSGAYGAAEGGRIPFAGGKKVLEGLASLANKIAPGSTKIGQTSKTMAPKTQLKKAIADFQNREKHKTLLDDFNKKYTVKDETKISSEQVGSLDEFHADFVKETGINVPKENLKQAWNIKKSYPFNTPIIDKNGKVLGGEATQQMYPKSKKFIVKDSDTLTREIEGKLPSGERAGINVPDMPAGFKLSREKLKQNFPELSLDQIDEIMNLDKEMQGRVITMLKNRRLDPNLYDELLLKHGDTLEFQGEFDKTIRRTKNASGGVAGMLGE